MSLHLATNLESSFSILVRPFYYFKLGRGLSDHRSNFLSRSASGVGIRDRIHLDAGGVTIFCIGLVGIYVSKVFIETKQRPYTIIRRIYGSDLTTREPSSLKTAFPAAHLSNGKRVTSEPEGLATGNR